MKIEFYRHNLGKKDSANLSRALKDLILTTGKTVERFEEKFSRYLGSRHTVGLTSCTAALQLSLLAYGIGPGDEVITTPMSFVATANAILHAGARPVFADVDPETGNIDPGQVERKITGKTKAIIPVHLYGQLCDMRRLRKIADRRRLFLIEDCAHCIEGEMDGVRPGQLGDAACFSFYATKSLTCGEGGAVSTNNARIAALIKRLRLHGMSSGAGDRYSLRYRHWDMDLLGWKYNMDNLRAALLLDQISRLEANWKKRLHIYRSYIDGLQGIPGLSFPAVKGKSALHLFTVWVDPLRRDRILGILQDKGIGVAVNYRAIHTLEYYHRLYGFRPKDFPVAWRIGASTISLPFYPKLTAGEIDYIVANMRSIILKKR